MPVSASPATSKPSLASVTTQANAFYHLPSDYAQSVMISSTSSKQADIDALAKRVDDTLGGTAAQATVQTANQQIQRNRGVFLILYAIFYSVVAIIALVGGIGLLNSLAMGVLERRREIGILRSMGVTGRKVAQVRIHRRRGLTGHDRAGMVGIARQDR